MTRCQLAAKSAVRDLIANEELTKGDANAPESRAATARAMYLGVHVRLQRKEEPPPKGSPRKKQKGE